MKFGLFHCILITKTKRKFKKHVNKYLLTKAICLWPEKKFQIYKLYIFLFIYQYTSVKLFMLIQRLHFFPSCRHLSAGVHYVHQYKFREAGFEVMESTACMCMVFVTYPSTQQFYNKQNNTTVFLWKYCYMFRPQSGHQQAWRFFQPSTHIWRCVYVCI
jgi:hypothetical protein